MSRGGKGTLWNRINLINKSKKAYTPAKRIIKKKSLNK